MNKGDLVMWRSGLIGKPPHYGVILDVKNHRGVLPEEVLVKFPLDGSEGWYLSENLVKMERKNEQG